MWGSVPANINMAEKKWYATDDVAGEENVGAWDLRDKIEEYIGHYDVSGKSVLELGPASGYMTFAMERMGASVTSIDTALDDPNTSWNFAPSPGMDIVKLGQDRVAHLTEIRNAYWFAHQKRNSAARVWYGDVLKLPADFGSYDVATLTAVLLHCRDITGIMQSMAEHVTGAMIITERHYPELPKLPLCRLDPAVGRGYNDTWWQFTPEFFGQYLRALGFPEQTVTFHSQKSVRRQSDIPMFTVVAKR